MRDPRTERATKRAPMPESTQRTRSAAAIADAVATVHGWPRGDHRALCTCEKHKPGESTCQCKSCEMVREGRCTICGQLSEARIRADEREKTAQDYIARAEPMVAAAVRADEAQATARRIAEWLLRVGFRDAAIAVTREFGGIDKGGGPQR